MPQLPDRPDLDQLRRQARELLRAAQGGDPAALRRLRTVSDKVTLSTAQLTLAREHGFPSWRRLAGEVERRRAALEDPQRSAPEPDLPAPPKSWREVTEWSARLLADRTGQDVAAWNRRVAETGIADEPSARWEMPVTVRQGDAGPDFGGPFVRGDRAGLAWSVERAP